jgi:hypothetical protein
VPLGDASCQCDQHTLDVCEFPQGLFGERDSATVVVLFDPDLVQPKPEVNGNGRVAGLVMGQEAEFADAPLSYGSRLSVARAAQFYSNRFEPLASLLLLSEEREQRRSSAFSP